MISRAADLHELKTIAVGSDEVVYVFLSLAGEPSALDEALLDEEERARAARLHRPADRHRFMAAHAALRLCLARCLDVDPAAVRYVNGIDGKPALTADLPSLEFNLSHSGDVALLAIARDRSVGVDVERVRHLPDATAIAESHFSAAEQTVLRSLPPQERHAAFFRCWTRKEAVIKAVGEGLGLALGSFDVDLAADATATVVRLEGRPAGQTDWSLRRLPAPSGYEAAGAVAATGADSVRWRTWRPGTERD